ncbi:hypothetical protein EVG20_g5805, partial [Dentipellis fragilis]
MQPYSSFTILLYTIVLALSSPDFASAFPTVPRFSQSQVDYVGPTHNATLVRRAPSVIKVPLSIIGQDLAYTATVDLGTNPGPFTMQMDTGSSDFWVYADVCPQRGNHKFASKSASSTMNINPQNKWGFSYGDGTKVAGVLAQDTLSIGSAQVQGYIFGLVGHHSRSNRQQIHRRHRRLRDCPWLPHESPQLHTIPHAERSHPCQHHGLESSAPCRRRSWRRDLPRRADTSLFDETTEVTLTNLDGGYWRVPVTGTKINGAPFAAITGQRIGALDSGSTGLVMPLGDAAHLNSQFPNPLRDRQDGLFYVPCDAQLELSLTIGERDWPIDPRDLVLQQTRNPQGYCLSVIQAGPQSLQGSWVLGAAFMKNVYSTMNFDTNQIKIAKLRVSILDHIARNSVASSRVDIMSALDIFGTVGTAISIIAMVYNIIRKWLPRGQLQDLMQIIVEIEELYQNTTQEGLCVDKDTTAKYDTMIAYLRSDAEYFQARCAAAKNRFHLCWIMFRGLARQIEYLTMDAYGVGFCIRHLRKSKRLVEDAELRRGGIGRRLGLTEKFTMHLGSVVAYTKHRYPGKRIYEFDRYLTPPEADAPRISEPPKCDVNVVKLLTALSASPLDSLNDENVYLLVVSKSM